MLLPAAASWVRAVRPALAVGLVVSSVVFALTHGSTDPWLAGYFVVFSLSAGPLAIISAGMEAPIAHHVANNVVAGIGNELLAGGDTPQLDRSAGAGDASLLVLMGAKLAMVGYVWLRERRARQATRTA